MIHDLYLMNANASLEATAKQKFEHRTLTFDEIVITSYSIHYTKLYDIFGTSSVNV